MMFWPFLERLWSRPSTLRRSKGYSSWPVLDRDSMFYPMIEKPITARPPKARERSPLKKSLALTNEKQGRSTGHMNSVLTTCHEDDDSIYAQEWNLVRNNLVICPMCTKATVCPNCVNGAVFPMPPMPPNRHGSGAWEVMDSTLKESHRVTQSYKRQGMVDPFDSWTAGPISAWSTGSESIVSRRDFRRSGPPKWRTKVRRPMSLRPRLRNSISNLRQRAGRLHVRSRSI